MNPDNPSLRTWAKHVEINADNYACGSWKGNEHNGVSSYPDSIEKKAFQVGADWARKETVKEICEWIDDQDYIEDTSSRIKEEFLK